MTPEALATDLYLGRLIATARRRRGLKQRELAAAINVGSTLIVDLENGRASLTADRRTALVQALGLKPDTLDAPGFVRLSPSERSMVLEAREASRCRALMRDRQTTRAGAEAASC